MAVSEQNYKIGLGGSCHWCTEAIFQSLLGVTIVEQGWITALSEPAPSEAIIVTYDSAIIDLHTLIEIHLHTHSCTSAHSMRQKYRSAIYVYSETQKQEAENSIILLQEDFDTPVITKVLLFESFKLNTPEYLNYYFNNPDKPFCKNIINPKLQILLARFMSSLDPNKIIPPS
ncbi:MAG: peptide methionine sulfoxide reductase [Eudoraea sp.]|nr:peptide methionine sulfoxide reductase [Eudoraea sp.]